MCVREYTYAYAAVEVSSGEMDTLILPKANAACMQLFIDEVSSRHIDENIVMVLDGASWHNNTSLRVPENMRLLHLPAYSPELNPVEHIWDELREKFFHNEVFNSMWALEKQLAAALKSFEQTSEKIQSIVSWNWIINSLSI